MSGGAIITMKGRGGAPPPPGGFCHAESAGAPRPFPSWALPRSLQAYVRAIEARMHVPVDYAGALVLGALSVACARKFAVGMMSDQGEEPRIIEPLNIFAASGLLSGSYKSPCFREVFSPIYALQAGRVDFADRFDEELERLLQMVDGVETPEEAARVVDAFDAGCALKDRLAALPDDLFTGNITPESLVRDLAENHERMALLSPDGGGIVNLLLGGRARGVGLSEILCQCYDGEPLRGSRISRDYRAVWRPSVTIALAVQPDILRAMASDPHLRLRGMFARFWCSMPKDLVGTRFQEGDPIPQGLRNRWRAVMAAAFLLPDFDPPMLLQVTGESYDIWRDFQDEIERKMRPGGEYGECGFEANKAKGRVARFAGLLHIATLFDQQLDDMEQRLGADPSAPSSVAAQLIQMMKENPADSPIALETVQGAVALSEYGLEHARHILGAAAYTPTDEMAKRIWGWITRGGKSTFTWSELGKIFEITDKSRRVIEGALYLLTVQGRLEEVDNPRRSATGRLPGRKWGVRG